MNLSSQLLKCHYSSFSPTPLSGAFVLKVAGIGSQHPPIK
jgi:hypothetical protein